MQFITYLPLRYNDGSSVPDADIQDILRDLYLRFGGATVSGPVQGNWVDPATQTVFSDMSWRVEVVAENAQLSEAVATVLEAGKKLRQEAMYFEVRYFDGVQILRVPTDD